MCGFFSANLFSLYKVSDSVANVFTITNYFNRSFLVSVNNDQSNAFEERRSIFVIMTEQVVMNDSLNVLLD